MSYKIVVKPTVYNKSIFRNRGLLYSDDDIVKDMAKTLARTSTFYAYFQDEEEFSYTKELFLKLGVKIYKE